MKKTLCRFLALLLIAGMLLCLCGCTKEKRQLRELMQEFQSACNALDFDRVLDCLEPKTADAIELASGVLGFFTHADTDALFDALASALSFVNLGGTESFRSLKIEVKEIVVEDGKAQLKTTFTYEFQKETVTKNVTVECVYEYECWYIATASVDS